jgi:hypothetical protein
VSLEPPLAVDQSGNVWLGVSTPIYNANLALAELNNASGLPNYLSPQPGGTGGTTRPSNFVNSSGYPTETQIAIDSFGNVWGGASPTDCTSGNLFKVPPYKGIGTTVIVSTVTPPSLSLDPFLCSAGVAVDGSGTVWTANAGGSNGQFTTPPNIAGYNPTLPNNTLGFVSSSVGNGPKNLAVDGSGNVWVLLQNNTVTEFIGVAAPTVAPLSVAVKNKKLGAKP